MTDKELYKQTFSHLHAPGTRIQEAGTMKIGKIRKSLAIGAAAAALMATAAGAANVATDGQLFENVKVFFVGDYTVGEDGSYNYTATDKDGNEIHVSVETGENVDGQEVEYTVSTTEDGENVAVENRGSINVEVEGAAPDSFVVVSEDTGDVLAVQSQPVEDAE